MGSATATSEGHDSLGVSAVLYNPEGKENERVRLESLGWGLDRWGGILNLANLGCGRSRSRPGTILTARGITTDYLSALQVLETVGARRRCTA